MKILSTGARQVLLFKVLTHPGETQLDRGTVGAQ